MMDTHIVDTVVNSSWLVMSVRWMLSRIWNRSTWDNERNREQPATEEPWRLGRSLRNREQPATEEPWRLGRSLCLHHKDLHC